MAIKGHKQVKTIDIDKRVNIVYDMIIKGLNYSQIVDACNGANLNWNLSKRQISNYIKKARSRILEASKATIEEEIRLAMARLDTVMTLAYKQGDLRLVVSIIKEKLRILGFNNRNGLNAIVNEENVTDFLPGIPEDSELQSLGVQYLEALQNERNNKG